VCSTCGINDTVVMIAARLPMMSVVCIEGV